MLSETGSVTCPWFLGIQLALSLESASNSDVPSMGPWGHSIKIKYVSFSKKRVLNRVLLAVRGKNGGQFHVWEIEPFGFASRMVNFGDFEIFVVRPTRRPLAVKKSHPLD